MNAIIYKVTKKNEIKPIVDNFQQNLAMRELYLYVEDVEEAMNEVLSLFNVEESAGGVVCNNNDEWLLIFRHEFWDLPKGRPESGESMPEAALREVEEECGIHELTLFDFLTCTYHTYKENEQIMLKKNYWYSMKYTGTASLIPQKEEGIIEARWVPRNEIPVYLPKMYSSITEVLQMAVC
ncbi:MAG: NUDIX domain-containing protein [Bacteroidales bacterium]|nr:NUDIX domain-containing protein [Bacteroidales bacterium]MCL2132749.1 NUDIX domain-containing protein [Bacteroidales bacterium]